MKERGEYVETETENEPIEDVEAESVSPRMKELMSI